MSDSIPFFTIFVLVCVQNNYVYPIRLSFMTVVTDQQAVGLNENRERRVERDGDAIVAPVPGLR